MATLGSLLALAVAGLSASGREREWGSLGSRRERTGERRELGRGVCWARRGGGKLGPRGKKGWAGVWAGLGWFQGVGLV